jgi:hypothetical protein
LGNGFFYGAHPEGEAWQDSGIVNGDGAASAGAQKMERGGKTGGHGPTRGHHGDAGGRGVGDRPHVVRLLEN